MFRHVKEKVGLLDDVAAISLDLSSQVTDADSDMISLSDPHVIHSTAEVCSPPPGAESWGDYEVK